MIFLQKEIIVEGDIHAQQKKTMNPKSTDSKKKIQGL
jgi:hypothetical protein